jgi:hypothetical protein
MTFVICYILVSFKFWCRFAWGWHVTQTCRSNIGLYLYISKMQLLVLWTNTLTKPFVSRVNTVTTRLRHFRTVTPRLVCACCTSLWDRQIQCRKILLCCNIIVRLKWHYVVFQCISCTCYRKWKGHHCWSCMSLHNIHYVSSAPTSLEPYFSAGKGTLYRYGNLLSRMVGIWEFSIRTFFVFWSKMLKSTKTNEFDGGESLRS